MTGAFDGKVVLVTGGAAGMGRATSVAFAAEGAKVVVADVNTDGGEETVELIRKDGGEATFIRTDVSQAADVRAAVDTAVRSYGGLDHAVNCAAIETETTLLAECEEDTFDRLIAVNLKSIFLCLKYEIRAMLQRGGGAIVNIASVNSFRPLPKQAAYTASKHGVLGLTKTAAIEYASMGIRVNAIAPGAIDTPMLRNAMATRGTKEEDAISRLSLMGRFGRDSEIAEAALWLCSDRSSYTVGHVLAVDGGYLAR
jgi:NAD(P)-dependent dehydrogenase (short-subunit alcohol dehydrogenase family)